jgi:transcriptional regulator with XRE-family HTH domain
MPARSWPGGATYLKAFFARWNSVWPEATRFCFVRSGVGHMKLIVEDQVYLFRAPWSWEKLEALPDVGVPASSAPGSGALSLGAPGFGLQGSVAEAERGLDLPRLGLDEGQFGRDLLEWRLCNAVSQEDLARRIGLRQSYICDLEKGRRVPSARMRRRIREALQTPSGSSLQTTASSPLPVPLPLPDSQRLSAGRPSAAQASFAERFLQLARQAEERRRSTRSRGIEADASGESDA